MIVEALLCMSLNIYFEARSEPIQGQIAVAEVTLNRVKSPDYPDTICGVVLQENEEGCQFSWWCDGLSDEPKEYNSFQTAKALARLMLEDGDYISVVGKNVTHYHTKDITPYWVKDFEYVSTVGKHIFYRSLASSIEPLPRPKIISELYNE